MKWYLTDDGWGSDGWVSESWGGISEGSWVGEDWGWELLKNNKIPNN